MQAPGVINYFGGKTRICKEIIKLFPPHKNYIEGCFGAGHVFFGRNIGTGRKREVINDIDSNIYNFYLQWRDNGEALMQAIKRTPYSREDFNNCLKVVSGVISADKLERARAFFVAFSSSFGGMGTFWAIDPKTVRGADTFEARKAKFFKLINRLQGVFIENLDILKLIKKWDNPDTLFYIDPPYPQADQSGYSHKYTSVDFNFLVKALTRIRGKFILSYYAKKNLVIPESWHIKKIVTHCSIENNTSRAGKTRMECLAMNFKP